ncbi:Rha family transcriptional regulator [Flagellimonas allohymeniacidonis]|uniref:Uncharacterized protein n=1 Tax=Flagellimonas allohymeniacidonis TaxID=2517819 RepID=A0A4Q8QEV1_9FLAO|nr:Rha family transcriptional regulator [Allomuricauda hymeniacidonis]TAI48995.1 hypothetical protein EW142_04150 [Allomuricauda hymeniacidonis]
MKEDRLAQINNMQNTSSRILADVVSKRHSDVLRTITNLQKNVANAEMRRLWNEDRYIDEQGKLRKEYLLTKKGLLLIVSKYSDELRLQIIERLGYLEREQERIRKEQKRNLELELSHLWNKSDRDDLYRYR